MEESSYKNVITSFLTIEDRMIRSFVLSEKLLFFEEEYLKNFLEDTIKFAFTGERNAIEILFSFVDILEGVFDKEISFKVLNRLSKLNAQNKTLHLFIFPPEPHRFLKRGETPISDLKMDYLPLGIKRSLAKKMDITLLRRMVFEKDPMIIKHLLLNPIITEKDVLKISSLRPTTEVVIKTVFSSTKWINSYAVKEALIKNPYSPFRIALILLFYMQKKELLNIKKDNTLHPELRYEASKIILMRKD